MHISQQAEMIDKIEEEASLVQDNMDRAVSELINAQERGVGFRHFVMLFFIVLGFALLFLNYITP